MYTLVGICIASILILLALYWFGTSMLQAHQESFADFNKGTHSPISGHSPEYFYAFLPTLAREMMEHIASEIGGSPDSSGDGSTSGVKTFMTALTENKEVK